MFLQSSRHIVGVCARKTIVQASCGSISHLAQNKVINSSTIPYLLFTIEKRSYSTTSSLHKKRSDKPKVTEDTTNEENNSFIKEDEDDVSDKNQQQKSSDVVDKQTKGDESDEKVKVVEAEIAGNGGNESENETDSALVSREAYFPEDVMVLPLKLRPVLPETGSPVLVTDEHLLSIIQNNFNRGKKYLGLFYVKEEFRSEKKTVTDISQIYQTGTLGQVIDLRRDVAGHAFVHVFGLRRIVAESALPNRPVLTVKSKQIKSVMPERARNEYVKAYVFEILKGLSDLIKNQPLQREFLIYLRQNMDENPSRTADFAAACTTAPGDEIQEIIECLDVEKRLASSLLLLKKELELSNFQKQVAKQIEEKVTKQQRQYMLQEQLKLIKKELGLETDEKEQLLTRFRDLLAASNPPDHARKVIDEEINKLSSLEASSSEYNVTRNYLEWLTGLPWSTVSTDNLDLDNVEKTLDHDHYGLDDVKDRIKEFIAVGTLLGKIHGKIICFVGPPGVGKTSIGKSIARAIDRKFFRFSVGGMSDVAEIKGHRRTYIGAMPGKIIQCLKSVQTSNPVILIDEIDKLSKGYSGDPASALLEVLDPEQNSSFRDHYLDVNYDLSKVLFLCTANVLDTIPKPLLDRMEVIRISGYVTEEKIAIAKQYLIPEAIKSSGLTNEQITIDTSAIDKLIRWYCREAGVRNLKQHVEKITRKVALKIAKKETSLIQIDSSNLEDFIGKPVYSSDRFYEILPPGVITGLAWTSLGGATLYIESVALPVKEGGKGRLQTTGQMGDVMKESSSVCYTYSKKFLSEIDPQNKFFETHDIHLHIPEGATPKDGPSAGVTMVTSLLSLALNRSCDVTIAMTGEITLTGKVLKIGGVREKIIAAKRSQINRVLLPSDNQRDFEELPDFIKDGVTIVYAANYADVFKFALP